MTIQTVLVLHPLYIRASGRSNDLPTNNSVKNSVNGIYANLAVASFIEMRTDLFTLGSNPDGSPPFLVLALPIRNRAETFTDLAQRPRTIASLPIRCNEHITAARVSAFLHIALGYRIRQMPVDRIHQTAKPKPSDRNGTRHRLLCLRSNLSRYPLGPYTSDRALNDATSSRQVWIENLGKDAYRVLF